MTFNPTKPGAREVLARLESSPDYELLLMDVQMSDLDGLETTIVIRQLEKVSKRHIPIIAVTAGATEAQRERCLMAGMDDYITKPVKPKSLLNSINRLCGRSKIYQALS